MLTILDKYIGKYVFLSVLVIFFILISLSGIIKFIEYIKKIEDISSNIWHVLTLIFLTIPRDIDGFFPMASMLGVLFGLGLLASTCELTVIQAIGYSRIQIAFIVMKMVAIPLIILVIIINEIVLPITEKLIHNYKIEKNINKSLFLMDYGLWLKDKNNFVYIKNVIYKNKIKNILILNIDIDKKIKSIVYADYAIYKYSLKTWELHNVKQSIINNKLIITNTYYVTMLWFSSFTPDTLKVILLEPNLLTVKKLYKYIKFLESNDQDSSIYKINLWKKIFSPISVIIMILIALSFVFGPLRNVSMGVRILIGIFFGFIFYLLNDILSKISILYGITPLISVVLPNIFGFILSVLILKRYSM